MRKSLWIVLALGLVVVPSAKADTFVFHVTESSQGLDITFDLPGIPLGVEFSVDNVTSFVSPSTLDGDPITNFGMSGNPTLGAFDGAGETCFGGTCWAGRNSAGVIGGGPGPAFSGTGTFSADGTTVTITDVPNAAPEPSSVALMLLGVGLVCVLRNSRGHLAT